MRFAMLMAVLLPLQAYAAMPVCQEQARTHITASHTSAAPQAQHDCAGADTARHHSCGQCCCAAAIALAPCNFIAPHLGVPEIAAAAIPPSPDGALDRLDRPPRVSLAR